MLFNTAKANIKGGKKFSQINGLPQSKDHCKSRFFGFHIHERNFLYRKLK